MRSRISPSSFDALLDFFVIPRSPRWHSTQIHVMHRHSPILRPLIWTRSCGSFPQVQIGRCHVRSQHWENETAFFQRGNCRHVTPSQSRR